MTEASLIQVQFDFRYKALAKTVTERSSLSNPHSFAGTIDYTNEIL